MRCLHWHRWLWQGCLTPLLRARSEACAREWQLGSRQIDNRESQRWFRRSMVHGLLYHKDARSDRMTDGSGWHDFLGRVLSQPDTRWHASLGYELRKQSDFVELAQSCPFSTVLVCPVYSHRFWVIDIRQSLQAKCSIHQLVFPNMRYCMALFFFIKKAWYLVPYLYVSTCLHKEITCWESACT